MPNKNNAYEVLKQLLTKHFYKHDESLAWSYVDCTTILDVDLSLNDQIRNLYPELFVEE